MLTFFSVRRVLALVIAATVGLMAFGLARWRSPSRALAWFSGRPILECPYEIDLGSRDVGDMVIVPFRIANRGRSTLEVSDFQNSCGCSGLDQIIDGQSASVSSLSVQPGGDAVLRLRWRLTNLSDSPQRVRLWFHTNDPDAANTGIDFLVKSTNKGAYSSPSIVSFAPIVLGKTAVQRVEIRDRADRSLTVENIKCDLDCVEIKALARDQLDESAPGLEGRRIACFEVALRGCRTGFVSGEIACHSAGSLEPFLRIPVRGEIVTAVRLTPATVVLPRQSEKGRVYNATVVCRSEAKVPIHLEVDSVPEPFLVRTERIDSSSFTVRIHLESRRRTESEVEEKHEIRFRAAVNGEVVPVALTVRCLGK